MCECVTIQEYVVRKHPEGIQVQETNARISPLAHEEQLKQQGLLPHSRQKTNFRKVIQKKKRKMTHLDGAFSGFGFKSSNPWLFSA